MPHMTETRSASQHASHSPSMLWGCVLCCVDCLQEEGRQQMGEEKGEGERRVRRVMRTWRTWRTWRTESQCCVEVLTSEENVLESRRTAHLCKHTHLTSVFQHVTAASCSSAAG